MRGENRDYIPRRQKGVKEKTCEASEGCAFKAKSERRRPHYREMVGGDEGMSRMGVFAMMTGDYDD
jgi:hypothetical protein